MMDILVYACFSWYGSSRYPLLIKMFNHDVCLCTSNWVYYFRLKINHMTELANVRLFFNLAWMWTLAWMATFMNVSGDRWPVLSGIWRPIEEMRFFIIGTVHWLWSEAPNSLRKSKKCSHSPTGHRLWVGCPPVRWVGGGGAQWTVLIAPKQTKNRRFLLEYNYWYK
jgi:hypothetical protein